MIAIYAFVLAFSPAPRDTAVFAGGCFWGIEAVFEHVKGVLVSESGYTGGTRADATYERVSNGNTGHAEAVRVIFDPAQVSYTKLLEVFFSVAHDPTQRNRQGPDFGPQYRSAVFFANNAQQADAAAYIAKLIRAKVHKRPIVTEVTALREFFLAEPYHQDYLMRHPDEAYIVINDAPKLVALRKAFPDLYQVVRQH